MMLELKNICKTYLQGKLEVPVLKNISLSVEEGEYVAIMGPSGSGKTTLMNLIGCLDSPTSGEYYLEEENVAQLSEKKMSEVRLRRIGFVFQNFYLLSRQSALENVALPLLYAGVKRKERMEIAKKALERVGLGDRTAFKPTQLSGGQCQRVAIARAIVNNPKVLLADEPTGALDTKSGEQIMEIFQTLNKEGVTIIMITHEQEIADHAQRVLHIRDGRLVDAQGNFLSPEEPEEEASPDLPEDLIPAKEFLSEPLEIHPTEELPPASEESFAPVPEQEEGEEKEEAPQTSETAAEPLQEAPKTPEEQPEDPVSHSESFLDEEISALLDGGLFQEPEPIQTTLPGMEPLPDPAMDAEPEEILLPHSFPPTEGPEETEIALEDTKEAETGEETKEEARSEKEPEPGQFLNPISIPLEELKPDLTDDTPRSDQ